MKSINLVSLFPILVILSTFAYLLKLPAADETQTDRENDPFSLLSAQLTSKHRELLLKLWKLHLAPGNHTNGSCLLYIGTLLVTLSNDVQLNPGPRPPKYPCGSCGAAVRNNQNSIQCDGCNFWFHISCQGMNTSIHHIMAEHASYSWSCLNCGLPNFSTAIYDDFSISDCSTNNFSVLDSSLPPRTSTPIKKKIFSKNSNKLKVININFRSVVNKVPELQCLIDTENPDVVIGTESWLSPEISSGEIFPSGYTAYRADRISKTRSGGVFILVRNSLICTEQAQFRTNCEMVWVKLEVAGVHPLYICAYYKPTEEDQDSMLELRRSIELVKRQTAETKGNIWVLGDFNLPKLTWTDRSPSVKPDCSLTKTYDLFLDLLNDFGFTQMVTTPTRQDNILDLFLTTNPTLVDEVDCQPGLGDHDMVTASCALKPSVQKQKPRKVPLLNKADWPKLKSLMRDYQKKFLLEHPNRSVEELWSDFVTALDTFSSKCIPSKIIRGKFSLTWITQNIRRQIRRRDDLYRKFKKTGDQKFRDKFLSLRKSIKHKIKASYNLYLEGLLGITDENSVCNNKKLFSFLKSAKQDQTGSPPLQDNNGLVTDTTEKANLHNQQFQSVFTTKAPLSLSRLCKMQIQDMADSGTLRHDAVPAGILNSNPIMEEFTISCNGILKLLQNLKPFKAAGPDKLKPLLLKELREEIAPIIQIIFERSLQTGKLPADWCKAQVTPIFKKGNKSSAANYRPISLTCILCKVLEHIIASHVVKHLNAHDLLYDLQHGFREKRSCETQLTMLVEDLARNVSKGKQTDLILLDFSKAFDKVNHSKLLWKLHQYGIRGNALAWIRAFLGDRSQTVVIDGEESESVPVTSGVPQGSVLGPILFLIYINDLPDELSSQVRLFADDTAVYLTIGDTEDGKVLQNDLDRLSVWEDRWDMEFNPSKCQVVRVTTSRRLIDVRPSLINCWFAVHLPTSLEVGR